MRLPGAAEPIRGRSSASPSRMGDGLDGRRALALLRELEADSSLAPRARMEAFLALDRLLGLDLALGLVPR